MQGAATCALPCCHQIIWPGALVQERVNRNRSADRVWNLCLIQMKCLQLTPNHQESFLRLSSSSLSIWKNEVKSGGKKGGEGRKTDGRFLIRRKSF